jgi:hypothetical protein
MAEAAVNAQRITVLEREMRELKSDFKELKKENAIEHDELDKKLTDSASSVGRIEIMFAHMNQRMDKMDKSIDTIAVAAGKDQGWRALITDIIKAIILIAAFFATGKIV